MESGKASAVKPTGQDGPMAAPDRSQSARARITDAVMTLLADSGQSGLTHRRVAEVAGVSLGATTYHYLTKADMLADTSRQILDDYLQTFQNAANNYREGGTSYQGLAGLMSRLVARVLNRDRRVCLAWYEIILEASRGPEGRHVAHEWYGRLTAAWQELLTAMGVSHDDCTVLTAIDTVIGLLFIGQALGLSAEQMGAVEGGTDPAIAWGVAPAPETSGDTRDGKLTRRTPKARLTRARILQGAIDVMVRDGAGAVTYRSVAEATGLTTTAPGYYFASIADLLREAETELFRASRLRYREALISARLAPPSIDGLADLVTAIFIREATEFGRSSVAHFSIWLEAARRPELRFEVGAAVLDQAAAWELPLKRLGMTNPYGQLRLQALFIGQLIRAIACGARLEQLAEARDEFRHAIAEAVAL